eukprot:6790662-Prymnesium_polylepis.1
MQINSRCRASDSVTFGVRFPMRPSRPNRASSSAGNAVPNSPAVVQPPPAGVQQAAASVQQAAA